MLHNLRNKTMPSVPVGFPNTAVIDDKPSSFINNRQRALNSIRQYFAEKYIHPLNCHSGSGDYF